jgi:hypothetical protein
LLGFYSRASAIDTGSWTIVVSRLVRWSLTLTAASWPANGGTKQDMVDLQAGFQVEIADQHRGKPPAGGH